MCVFYLLLFAASLHIFSVATTTILRHSLVCQENDKEPPVVKTEKATKLICNIRVCPPTAEKSLPITVVESPRSPHLNTCRVAVAATTILTTHTKAFSW